MQELTQQACYEHHCDIGHNEQQRVGYPSQESMVLGTGADDESGKVVAPHAAGHHAKYHSDERTGLTDKAFDSAGDEGRQDYDDGDDSESRHGSCDY